MSPYVKTTRLGNKLQFDSGKLYSEKLQPTIAKN